MTAPRIIQFQVKGTGDKETVWVLDETGQLWCGYMATLTPVRWHWDTVDGPT